MKTLTYQETRRHLEELTGNSSRLFEKPAEAGAFAAHCRRLVRLLDEHHSSELSVSLIRDALFPNATGDSSRVLFANFRKTLAEASSRDGREFSLIQPDLRGRDTSTFTIHFTGSSISTQPDLDGIALRAVAGLDRQTLIQAPAAFLTGESLQRLVTHFTDPQTAARLPVRFFLSYAHKNSKFKDKLVGFLTDQLATSSRFAFSIWQDKGILAGNEWHREIQTALAECDLCLSLLSPAFLTSTYIRENEIPPIVAGVIPAILIALEPLDFDRQNLHGLEKFQISSPAFLHCTTTAAQKEFARSLAHQIEEKVTAVAHAIARRFATDFLSGKSEARDFAACHPELLEILSACETPPSSLPAEPLPAPELSTKLRFNSLLTVCLKSLPPHVIVPFAATGNLDQITKQITDRASEDDAPDPYSIFRLQQQNAVDHLALWAQDPLVAPFAAVLGEIGSGKTTTLRMLAQRLAQDPTAPPVIFIDLKDYSNSTTPTLEDILTDHLRRYDSGQTLSIAELITSVRSERALIIYDGLDEKIIALSEEARRNFISELWRILPLEIMDQPAETGRGKLIISCRSHYFQSVQAMGSGYLGNDRVPVTGRDYLACVMLPWQDEQIRDYLSALLGPDKLETALDLIDTVHNLKDLASRPYLISLIGPELEDLEKDRAAGRIVNAASLYRKFIARWLYRDDGKHVFRPAHKLRLMENLAATLWRENARTWPWERVEEWLESFLHENPVIKSALEKPSIGLLHQDFRTATFFLRPDACAESFRFAHTSLQEYFLACHLARALENSDLAAWDLPEPSRETFDFLGQHLLTLTAGPRNKALTGLAGLLNRGAGVSPAAHLQAAGETPAPHSRLNALRYHLQAHAKSLPVPESPALDASGLDLEGWEFHGSPERLLAFAETTFANANLIRSSFEHVHFQPGVDFRAADLSFNCYYACLLPGADFRGSLIHGAFFRECDLSGLQVDQPNSITKVTAHYCSGNPWPLSLHNTLHSGIFAHGHSSEYTSVTCSNDGKLILSGSNDKTLKLWDAATGIYIRSFSIYEKWISSVAFSDNDKLIAAKDWKQELHCWQTDGTPVPVPANCEDWFNTTLHSPITPELIGRSIIRLRLGAAILREILPLPNGQSIVREPWDEEEARKPDHNIRWKFTHGPKDAWRWCIVVDPETGAFHPPELAAVPGAFSGPEVGPL